MTPATQAKAATIGTALRKQCEHTISSPALLQALLTSANKDGREGAKRAVRVLVRAGSQILEAERTATNRANFANRHEP